MNNRSVIIIDTNEQGDTLNYSSLIEVKIVELKYKF